MTWQPSPEEEAADEGGPALDDGGLDELLPEEEELDPSLEGVAEEGGPAEEDP